MCSSEVQARDSYRVRNCRSPLCNRRLFIVVRDNYLAKMADYNLSGASDCSGDRLMETAHGRRQSGYNLHGLTQVFIKEWRHKRIRRNANELSLLRTARLIELER